jgi:hypothetical protein
MKQLLSGLLGVFISATMAACGPGKLFGPTLTMTPTNTLTPTSTYTPTLTPTATEIPMPESLNIVPAGYSAVHNPDGTWGYGVGAGAKVSIPDLIVDTTGAHFRLEGTSIDIAPADISTRIQVGQEGALQIYNYTGSAIEFAWDAAQNEWINAADVIQSNRKNTSAYITVQTRDQIAALFALEPLLLPPFPKDTYFPPLDKLSIDYWIYDMARDYYSPLEFDYYYPFGKATDPSKLPFRFVNFILLAQGEGRKSDTYIVTEQVFNPADGTFSLLHFGIDKHEKSGNPDQGLSDLLSETDPPHIFIPQFMFNDITILKYPSCNGDWCNTMDWLVKNNYWDVKTGWLPEIKQMVQAWITTGKVPDELEELVLKARPTSFIMQRTDVPPITK